MHPLIHTASPEALGAWLTLAGLGAYHGINPAMGWLFALAIGLQQKNTRAIWLSLLPIAVGHAASIALVAVLLLAVRNFVPLQTLQFVTAGVLIAFGIYKLVNWYRHPRWVGMHVNGRELAGWSFLMATAHGAGLMIAPVLLGMMGSGGPSMSGSSMSGSSMSGSSMSGPMMMIGSAGLNAGLAVGLHTLSMLVTMAVIAWVVYKKLGLMVLRQGWVNFDLIWSAALFVVGGVALYLAF